MSRTLTTAVRDALSASHVPMLVLVELSFSSGYVRVCNAGYTFKWGGNDFLGLGNLGSIDAVQEGGDLQAYGISFSISGIPPEYISLAFGHDYQGRPAKMWLAPLTSDYQIIADPALAFAGRMDVMNIELGTTATITVSAESRLIDWERPRVRRFNDEDQQAKYPGDLGMQYVAQCVEKSIVWGRPS